MFYVFISPPFHPSSPIILPNYQKYDSIHCYSVTTTIIVVITLFFDFFFDTQITSFDFRVNTTFGLGSTIFVDQVLSKNIERKKERNVEIRNRYEYAYLNILLQLAKWVYRQGKGRNYENNKGNWSINYLQHEYIGKKRDVIMRNLFKKLPGNVQIVHHHMWTKSWVQLSWLSACHPRKRNQHREEGDKAPEGIQTDRERKYEHVRSLM